MSELMPSNAVGSSMSQTAAAAAAENPPTKMARAWKSRGSAASRR
jgi:hypothetical protein